MLKFAILFVILNFCSGARILGIIPTPSYSHQVAFRPLWKELLKKGHQLTLITTDPFNDKRLSNLTEIDFHYLYDMWNREMDDLLKGKITNPLGMLTTMFNFSNYMNDLQLSHPQVQQIIGNKNETFDLLILETFYVSMFAFGERFNCPSIGVVSLDAPASIYGSYGNPAHPILNPDISLPFIQGNLTFIERIISVVATVVIECIVQWVLISKQQLLVEKHFGEGYHINNFMKNVSMLFVNADPIFSQIRPLVPAVIQIGGGTHLTEPKPLPKDLQNYLDKATGGFVYFSLGSNVKSKDLLDNVKETFLGAFQELPYKILWKFEAELPSKPSNVFVAKWLPQQDVLRHPNIKLFITQGGIQSMEEAVYSRVPMVCIPFFGDQYANAKKMVHKGLGLSLSHKTLDKETLKKTMLEVIKNPVYRNNAAQLATLASDQPMTGLEKAVWWTEYVIRHKGASHLRNPILDLPTYQYYLLDVIGFCLAVLLTVMYALVMVVNIIIRNVRPFIKAKEKLQ